MLLIINGEIDYKYLSIDERDILELIAECEEVKKDDAELSKLSSL